MKTTNRKAMAVIIIGVLGCLSANAQSRPQPNPTVRGNAAGGSGGGGGGYTSGGERGSVVQVMRNPEVRAELSLTDRQELQVSNVLRQVKAKEDELRMDVRRSARALRDAMRALSDEDSKRHEEAHQQLARATEQIVAQLTATQRTQLQDLCRQALADERGFQERMTRIQGPGGSIGWGGGSGGGSVGASGSSGGGAQRREYASGGGPGGVVRVISYPGVQAQLKLSDEQRAKIAEITGQMREFESALNANLPSSRTEAFEQKIEQRQQQMEEQKQKADSTRQAVARAGEEITHLLTPAQQKRLQEIRLQVQGADALFKPETIRALGLTATQQIKLGQLREQTNRELFQQMNLEMRKLGKLGGQTPRKEVFSEGYKQRVALQHEGEQRMISSVLTPEQQRKLQEIKGKEFAGVGLIETPSAGGRGGGSGSSSSSAQPKSP